MAVPIDPSGSIKRWVITRSQDFGHTEKPPKSCDSGYGAMANFYNRDRVDPLAKAQLPRPGDGAKVMVTLCLGLCTDMGHEVSRVEAIRCKGRDGGWGTRPAENANGAIWLEVIV